jgi:uncharacterized membrane protein YhaH (DUF805 family)
MNPNNPNPNQQPQPTGYEQPPQFVQPQPPTNPSLPLNNYPSQTQYPGSSTSIQKGIFKGRLNRIGYLLTLVCILIDFLIPLALQSIFKGNPIIDIITILFGIVGVVLMIPISISVAIRRWHDLNQTGWLMLLGLIPVAGFLLLIIYIFVPGTKTANNYGDVDNQPFSIGKILFGK